MSRRWVLVLALSVGLNLGLLWDEWGDRLETAPRPWPMGEGRRAGRHPGPDRRPGPSPEHLDRRAAHLADRLGLDDDQRARMRDVAGTFVGRMVERRERAGELRSQIRTRLSAAEVDSVGVRELIGELRRMESQRDSLVVEIMIREADLLSPDQRALYFERMPWPGEEGSPRSGDRPGGRRRRASDDAATSGGRKGR